MGFPFSRASGPFLDAGQRKLVDESVDAQTRTCDG